MKKYNFTIYLSRIKLLASLPPPQTTGLTVGNCLFFYVWQRILPEKKMLTARSVDQPHLPGRNFCKGTLLLQFVKHYMFSALKTKKLFPFISIAKWGAAEGFWANKITMCGQKNYTSSLMSLNLPLRYAQSILNQIKKQLKAMWSCKVVQRC